VTWLTKEDNHRARAVYDRVGARSEPFVEYELELSRPRNDSA
jgi:RimJ/RimL family protein N-acetyltransferase